MPTGAQASHAAEAWRSLQESKLGALETVGTMDLHCSPKPRRTPPRYGFPVPDSAAHFWARRPKINPLWAGSRLDHNILYTAWCTYGRRGTPNGSEAMISADAIRAILHDPAIHPVAAKLYVLLSEGKSLDEVAATMNKAPKSLGRYERQLRKAGYLTLVHELTGDGKKSRRYIFNQGATGDGRLAS